MTKFAFALTFSSICLVACSQNTPPPAGKDAQSTPPAAAASSSQQPAPVSEPAKPEATATTGSAAAPPVPEFREVTIPAGTSISVTLLDTLASNASKPEDKVGGAVARPVVVSGLTALPAGAQLSGAVTEVHESGRVKGKASVAFRFQQLLVRGESYQIQTAQVKQEAGSGVKGDVKKGAAGAGLGAIVGGVAGGGKGAAIGAVAGGAGTVLATKGDEIQVPAGTAVTVLLQQPLTLTVPLKKP